MSHEKGENISDFFWLVFYFYMKVYLLLPLSNLCFSCAILVIIRYIRHRIFKVKNDDTNISTLAKVGDNMIGNLIDKFLKPVHSIWLCFIEYSPIQIFTVPVEGLLRD